MALRPVSTYIAVKNLKVISFSLFLLVAGLKNNDISDADVMGGVSARVGRAGRVLHRPSAERARGPPPDDLRVGRARLARSGRYVLFQYI